MPLRNTRVYVSILDWVFLPCFVHIIFKVVYVLDVSDFFLKVVLSFNEILSQFSRLRLTPSFIP